MKRKAESEFVTSAPAVEESNVKCDVVPTPMSATRVVSIPPSVECYLFGYRYVSQDDHLSQDVDEATDKENCQGSSGPPALKRRRASSACSRRNSGMSMPVCEAESKVETTEATRVQRALSGVDMTAATWREVLGAAWFVALAEEVSAPYFQELLIFVEAERARKKIYPPKSIMFNAFQHTPLDRVKVVVVGQDPYHQHGQAMGLSFSVPPGVAVPPSLRNMYKEIDETFQPQHGDLTSWADQGVFLLNTVLTVEDNKAHAHKNKGWEQFTKRVLQVINEQQRPVIFFLWGMPAKKAGADVDRARHHVFESGHPSPLSVRHFKGCEHFQKANALLEARGEAPVRWLPPPRAVQATLLDSFVASTTCPNKGQPKKHEGKV